MKKKNVVVLGSTGSIGENAFRILRRFPDRFSVYALAAKRNLRRLGEQAAESGACRVVSADVRALARLHEYAPPSCRVSVGEEALIDIVTAPEVDVVVCAIVGTGGLLPTLAALRAGKRVALASKEVMVMAGELVNAELAAGHGELVPVDSEHSALFQCLQGRREDEVAKLWLTASGGAFRDWNPERLEYATCEDALRHPVWEMGPKVTIDSASLMNKVLELIEARYLFRVPPEKLGVVIHPQSVVHSMVELSDGALIAQMSQPDMRFAIQYALTYPERWDGALPRTGWGNGLRMDFEAPDLRRFPVLALAEKVLASGGTACAALNAANEVAVEYFCAGRIAFPAIGRVIGQVVASSPVEAQRDLETVFAADRSARELARTICESEEVQSRRKQEDR